MPLVLTENEVSGSGITYSDWTGVVYQYPTKYRRVIRQGELFVYYKGRRRREGGVAPQVYFGTGVVGHAMADPAAPDRLICEILDYRPFASLVPFKDERGRYLETGAERRGYFQPGVRTISDVDFRHILEYAAATAIETPINSAGGQRYASTQGAREVDDFAIRVAQDELRRRYSGAALDPQPRNNPGFDILLRTAGMRSEILYVEVKGTRGIAPKFFLTEGERQFATLQASRFCLLIVHSIDLDNGTRLA